MNICALSAHPGLGRVSLNEIKTKWSNELTNRNRQIIFVSISFFWGALLLCLFSTLQKEVIGAPLGIRGYFVPLLFGGMSGGIIGYYVSKIKEYHSLLKERINTLEKFLPICSNCKKIRDPDADPKKVESWEQIESYISGRTSTRFSHGICPECRLELYDINK